MVSFRHDEQGPTSARRWAQEVDDAGLPGLDLGGATRLVAAAAHPDDETLGAGGLVARAHRLGLVVEVVVATRGEACHPSSPTHPPSRLAALRTAELETAVGLLSPGTRPLLLDLPDGGVGAHEDTVATRLVEVVGDGRDTVLASTWRGDHHPDHEAVGRAAATAAARTGARLVEYPVWLWHWGTPADVPWAAATRLDLDPAERAVKQDAVAAHRTQVRPLSPAPGDEVLLGVDFLAHFAASYEVFWEGAPHDDALEALHRATADPWGVDRRWYEERKRSLLLAVLPRRRFRRALEVGCSTGALAADLLARCDELVALDASPSAVAAARTRLPGADVRQARLPDEWPDDLAGLDLVVLSEVGYFLGPAALDALADRVRAALAPEAVVVLCHWRHPVVGWPLDGPAVHARLAAAGLPPVVASYRDRDVEILLLADPDRLPDPHE